MRLAAPLDYARNRPFIMNYSEELTLLSKFAVSTTDRSFSRTYAKKPGCLEKSSTCKLEIAAVKPGFYDRRGSVLFKSNLPNSTTKIERSTIARWEKLLRSRLQPQPYYSYP
ncbi:MAG TPA: hypothetical protein DCY88_26765, partial [Cyanobacteria bacterium UBA11372]|nr:hypothetical protein [Cyanobacteria bacterium UBA11372]